MKILVCPVNGPRNIDEFQSFGPVRETPDPVATDDPAWAVSLFRAENRPRVVLEWWRHVPSNTFFQAERDLSTNQVLRSFIPGEPAPTAPDVLRPDAPGPNA